jgi:transposase
MSCRSRCTSSSAPRCATSTIRDLNKVASALRPIYSAANADQALAELERFDEQWGGRYPATVRAWRDCWEHVIPFLSLPEELRRAVYTTNTIEGLHRQIRKAIKTRGHSPTSKPRPSDRAGPRLTEASIRGFCPRERRRSAVMARPRKYPPELLDRGARLVLESGRPIAHVAKDLGVPSETLRRWLRQLEADEGLRPDPPTAAEREEIKQLRKEVYELRRANEILKAASVFFATELDADRPK